MDTLRKKATYRTPLIELNPDKGEFRLQGKSIPEHSREFYKPVMSWLEQYVKNPSPETILHIELEYFNSASEKMFIQILKKLSELQNKGKDVQVKWYYQDYDDEMEDTGKIFEDITGVPIEFIPRSSDSE